MTPLGHSPPVPEQLRILVVVPFPPRLAGTHGGAKAVAELLARTAARHRLALVYLSHHGEPGPEPELTDRFDLVREIERPAEPTGAVHLLRALRRRIALLTGTPLWVSDLWSRRTAKAVRDVAASWRPDVIRLEYPVAAALLGRSAAPKVLVDYDPLLAQARSASSMRERIEQALDRRAWRRFDSRWRQRVEAVVVLTERDRRVVDEAGGARLLVCLPLGIEPLPALDGSGKEDSLLFVGNLNHPANRDAVTHLIEEIVPRVRARRPEVVLTVVGQELAGAELPAATESVRFTGLVDDVMPYLNDAAVVLAPLRRGGGMRVKVLEALSAGKAVVAYPNALEGIAVESGRHIVVATAAPEYADAVADLLDDRERRLRIGREARSWALEHAGWDSVVDAYDELYRTLLEG
jgi:glycosyltransferase involved in cell wall biosynthesis